MPIKFNNEGTTKINIKDRTGQRHTINVDEKDLKVLTNALVLYETENSQVHYRHEISPYTVRTHIENLLDEEAAEFTGIAPLPTKQYVVLEHFLSLDPKVQNKIASNALCLAIEKDFKEEFYTLMDKVVDRTTERIIEQFVD